MNKQENLTRNVQELCDILNKSNFKDNGSDWYVGSNPKFAFDGGICYDIKAFNFLKSNGHLDRRICWKCGEHPIPNTYSFTHVANPSVKYSICQSCYGIGNRIQNPNEGQGSSNCYIATVCYEDINAEQVQILRDYRDKYLALSKFGLLFIKLYYMYSPRVASYLAKTKTLNIIVRNCLLNPIVFIIKKYDNSRF